MIPTTTLNLWYSRATVLLTRKGKTVSVFGETCATPVGPAAARTRSSRKILSLPG